MTPDEFLKLVAADTSRCNYMAVCADNLGVTEPAAVRRAFVGVAAEGDIYFLEAKAIYAEQAREIARDAHLAARFGSAFNIYVISRLQFLPKRSASILIKTVEEAKSSKFIFQANSTPPKIHTLMSRSAVIRLPFMSRAAVLASLSDQDAKAAEEFQLYDGTPLGTLQLVSMKEEIAYIRRNLPRGAQGYVAICKIIDSPALKLVLNDIATNEEREFLLRDPTRHRQGIVLSLIMARGGPWPWQASDE